MVSWRRRNKNTMNYIRDAIYLVTWLLMFVTIIFVIRTNNLHTESISKINETLNSLNSAINSHNTAIENIYNTVSLHDQQIRNWKKYQKFEQFSDTINSIIHSNDSYNVMTNLESRVIDTAILDGIFMMGNMNHWWWDGDQVRVHYRKKATNDTF